MHRRSPSRSSFLRPKPNPHQRAKSASIPTIPIPPSTRSTSLRNNLRRKSTSSHRPKNASSSVKPTSDTRRRALSSSPMSAISRSPSLILSSSPAKRLATRSPKTDRFPSPCQPTREPHSTSKSLLPPKQQGNSRAHSSSFPTIPSIPNTNSPSSPIAIRHACAFRPRSSNSNHLSASVQRHKKRSNSKAVAMFHSPFPKSSKRVGARPFRRNSPETAHLSKKIRVPRSLSNIPPKN